MQRLADLVNNAAISMVLSIIAIVVGVETFLGKKNTEFVSTNIFSFIHLVSQVAALPVLSSADRRAGIPMPSRAIKRCSAVQALLFNQQLWLNPKGVNFIIIIVT